MQFLMLMLLLASVTNVQAECSPSTSMSASLPHICLGQSFSLSCMFSCLSHNQSIEIKKSGQVISRLHLSNTSSGTKLNGSLVLQFSSASKVDIGVYYCDSNPAFGLSYCNLKITDCPVLDVPSTIEPTHPLPTHSNSNQSAGTLENTLMWYLLCKTGVFLMCSMSAALKHKSHIC